MKNNILLPFVLLSTILLSGCAGKSGHAFSEKMSESEVSAKLIKDKTTKEQVKNMFGDPEDIDLREDGSENWVYKFVRSSAKAVNFVPYANLVYSGTNDTIKRLKILFNAQGTVNRFAFSNATGETKQGLFQ
ncbi:MAG: hypothetical protein ACRYE9_03400 [Janthinobacterium lividum]